MDLPAGVTSNTVTTSRLTTHYLEAGDPNGEVVVFIQGNLASSRFFEHLFSHLPEYRSIAPDMRGFGDSESASLDGTRGLRDWSDDVRALVEHLGITDPVHLVGWSTGGAAVAHYAVDHPGDVASITLLDPVSPYGFGGTTDTAGTPAPDFAGSGGGVANPEFVRLLSERDAGGDTDFHPRNIMKGFYWNPEFQLDPEREDMLVGEVLKAHIGDHGYPGDLTQTEHWPTVAPGTTGILNALSGKYCRWDDIVGLDAKPPILWTHGTNDLVVSDLSMFDMGTLGQMGAVPGWPGEDVFPPQPMVGQIAAVLDQYEAGGGTVRREMFEGSGHGPHIDAEERWIEVFREFLASVD